MASFLNRGSKTSEQIMKGKSMEGSTAVITGASSGIGKEMTRQLAMCGCNVIMAVRKQDSGEYAAKQLRDGFPQGLPTGQLEVMQCDLSSFEDIRGFVAQLQARRVNINYLVLNAARKATPKWSTKEGHELQMGVNFLAHFHLVQLLLPSLQAQLGPVRVVAVTCKGELDGAAMRMTDLNFSKTNYDPLKAYKGSKIALALFGKELARRTADTNITVYNADPGNSGETNINMYGGPLMAISLIGKAFLKTVGQAAATPLFCLVAPEAPAGKRRSSFRGAHGIQSGDLVSECKTVHDTAALRSAHLGRRVWEEAEQMVQRSQLNSHVANAGFEREGQSGQTSLWVLTYVLRPMMDFIMRMFGLKKY